jgi:hypothetical protein
MRPDEAALLMMGDLFTHTAKEDKSFYDASAQYCKSKAERYQLLMKLTQSGVTAAIELEALIHDRGDSTLISDAKKQEEDQLLDRAKRLGSWLASINRRLEHGHGGDTKGEGGDSASNKFATLLRDLREQRFLTRKQLSEQSTVPEFLIAELETGLWASERVDPTYVKNLAIALGVGKDVFDEILGRSSHQTDEEN